MLGTNLFSRLFPLTLFAFAASGATAGEYASKPCALLTESQGDVTVVDETGSVVLERKPKMAVPCESWISVRTGSAIAELRSGVQLRLAPNTFVQLLPFTRPGDSILLYKGKVFANVPSGGEEFRVRTANGRTRTAEGRVLVIYNQLEEETQAIALQGTTTFENLFVQAGSTQASKKEATRIHLAAGEASLLNIKIKRVIPTTPRAVHVSSLKERLDDLPLTDEDVRQALLSANERSERTFASLLKDRKPASPSSREAKSSSSRSEEAKTYERHPVSAAHKVQDQMGFRRWMQKVTGGTAHPERILFPSSPDAQSRMLEQQANLQAHSEGTREPSSQMANDPGVVFDVKEQKLIDQERDRIISELKRIRLQDGE